MLSLFSPSKSTRNVFCLFFSVNANKTQAGFCPHCHALSCLSLDWLSITRLGCLCRALSFLGIWQDETGLIAEIACLARSVAKAGCSSDWLTEADVYLTG